jgi:hypothetical protein
MEKLVGLIIPIACSNLLIFQLIIELPKLDSMRRNENYETPRLP